MEAFSPLLLAVAAWAADPPGECGLSPEVIPDFALQDANPNSATYGLTVRRDDHKGAVMVMYWAVAT